MWNKKKKKKEAAIELDYFDDEKFIIYQIYKPNEFNRVDKTFKPSKVASPYFGSNVVDRNAFIDNAGTMDVDYGYDYVRKEEDKHISEEELIEKHGTKYYEFNDQILNNKKIIEYAGGGYEKKEGEEKYYTPEPPKVEQKPKNSFISSIDDVMNSDLVDEEYEIEIPTDFDKTPDYKDQEAVFNMNINIDTDDEYEHNSYSNSMPKPTQVNIPSFLTENDKREEPKISFNTPKLDEEEFVEEINYETPAEVYSNPAVDRNISIEEAINRAKTNDYKYEEKKTPVLEPQVERQPKPERKPEPQVNIKFNKYENYKIPYKDLFPLSKNALDDHPIWLEEKKEIINNTLKAFGIDGEVISYTKGPAFTLYEIMLSPGVNVKKVNQIYDNLQMNLQVKSIRIQSPIPGRNTVGIEAPNDVAEVVNFGDILNDEYMNNNKPLCVALGKNIDGTPVYQDITEMPHALIAGATQSGKSVSINTILVSLLIKNSPADLKLILVDPKKVELTFYEGLPHLATPVIDDPMVATEALRWACVEMDRRYDLLSRNRVRKVSDYNKKRETNPDMEPMPFIVIIVDEFNDLVMQCGSEVNDYIIRLAQKARACGIHIILATQRPTVDVVSGTIKANVPCRIAFRVAAQIDSSTILDEPGAENLLGRGDMLIKNNGAPLRAQGAYISDDEIGNICDFICAKYEPEYLFTHDDLRKTMNKGGSSSGGGKDASGESDELLYAIACYCVDSNSCSINSIQNQFSLGFNRASRIVSLLEEMQVVSPKNGTKSREILVDSYQLREIFGVDD